MKKANVKDDEMRTEYTRADLGPLVRGKYAARYAKATNIVVIDPALTKAFPNKELSKNYFYNFIRSLRGFFLISCDFVGVIA